jgi:hypothetical protein
VPHDPDREIVDCRRLGEPPTGSLVQLDIPFIRSFEVRRQACFRGTVKAGGHGEPTPPQAGVLRMRGQDA